METDSTLVSGWVAECMGGGSVFLSQDLAPLD